MTEARARTITRTAALVAGVLAAGAVVGEPRLVTLALAFVLVATCVVVALEFHGPRWLRLLASGMVAVGLSLFVVGFLDGGMALPMTSPLALNGFLLAWLSQIPAAGGLSVPTWIRVLIALGAVGLIFLASAGLVPTAIGWLGAAVHLSRTTPSSRPRAQQLREHP
jgi:hypothetical protein